VIFYSFWCPNCGRYSALSKPALLGVAVILFPAILFVPLFVYFQWLGWLLIIPALILGTILSYVELPFLSHLLNQYVPLDDAPE
jgi:hypothetical protein